ncbi:BREX protein BrxB domain-containing protein [Leptospira bouyouniensis]|uniref:DUF1788 domain-containing protein n=1 Tax=Leptospira bouyouniensis TaxID=2484911 RepID=A0ABY2L0L4_9LEPT|nr:BREX protein BrxB domain-containing protein [Leptospira bouyouniensis]TGK45911.1 DUF1788 domain-containing protein [Leptospira bouyouniensis]
MSHDLLKRLNDLKKDILHPEGIQVTQSQNYPFSIFIYPPADEFTVRAKFVEMIQDIKKENIEILEINLAHECLELLKQRDGDWTIDEIIQKEKEFFEDNKDYRDTFALVNDVFSPILEDENGISKSILNIMETFKSKLEGRKGIVFITRAGFLYPFYRTSSLLKFLTNTRGLSVVFLYPGTRTSETSLSYMGVMSPDSNYRPRMY